MLSKGYSAEFHFSATSTCCLALPRHPARKVYLLLNPKSILSRKGREVTHAHKKRGVAPQVNQERLRVARLFQSLWRRYVSKGEDRPLHQPGLLSRFSDDLMRPLTVDREGPVANVESMTKRIGLKAFRKMFWAGDRFQLATLADSSHNRLSLKCLQMGQGDPEDLGDPKSGLEE